jgi:hypothetical protein
LSEHEVDLKLVRDLVSGEITGERVGVIPTHEELCQAAGVDPEAYETTRVNPWTTSHGNPKDGIIQIVNWLRRIGPKAPASASGEWPEEEKRAFIEEIRRRAPKPRGLGVRKPGNLNRLFGEVQLADAHIRMLSWHEETREDYDINIQRRVLLDTGLSLVQFCHNRGCSHVQFIVGHDLFHADGPDPFTPASKNLLDVDSRHTKGFRLAAQIYRILIDKSLELGMTVEVIVVSGNHDATQTWFLGEVLSAIYEQSPHVTVDNSPNPRKYSHRGRVLVMHTHGHQEKVKELPQIMAQEKSREWFESTWRECHLGHLHHESSVDLKGVVVRRIPAMCATDAYHHGKGYVSNVRAGVAFVWDEEAGLTSINFEPVRYTKEE